MVISLGYLKDCLAVAVFSVLLVITLCTDTVPKVWLQALLIAAIVIDGTFTLCPRLHNLPL